MKTCIAVLPGVLPWLLLGACGPDAVSPPATSQAPDTVVDSIWVEPAARTIGVLGTTFDVGAAALNSEDSILYGTTNNPERFTWSSSAPDVAKLGTWLHAPTGNLLPEVTGVGEGTAIITTTSQGVTGSMTVTVYDRAGLGWSVPIPGGMNGGNVIGADGTIYVAHSDPVADRTLWYAVEPGGGISWTLELPLHRPLHSGCWA